METKERRKRNRPAAKNRDDAVYTQPKPFIRNRFLLRLATVLAIVLALVFGMSIFFKVDKEKVTVSGTEKYSGAMVLEASGIVDGENLLALSKARVSGNIMEKLPYVYSVRVGRELPDTVHIQITELEVVYSIADTEGTWWLISSDGKVVDRCAASAAEDYTKILGVELGAVTVGQQAVAYEPEPPTGEDGETVPVTVYARQKLETALQVVQNMEAVRMIGAAASVDVSQTGELEIWYGTQFQMLLGDDTDLYKKLDALKQAADQMGAFDTGILDASFTIWPDQVGYTPFS